jgi:2-polyprenyl-6-methoxyphenol hydroxylase-like FAD-dependent oxidoreductase
VAEVVVAGAGLGGLLTALLLAGDGHRVTVVERDGGDAPANPAVAWDEWPRRGVPQFRQLFYLLPRFRQLAEQELPEVVAALDAVALRHQPLADVTTATDERDPEIVALTARRPIVEAAVALLAATNARIDIRRGTAVRGLVAGEPVVPGVPHVTGVVTDAGAIAADLVVDATGRRSPLSQWLAAIRGRPLPEVVEDSGFVYHSRHFRSADGTVPALRGPLLQHFGSLSVLTLPAEAGTWGIGLITSSRDTALRSLHRVDRWTAVARALTPIAHWVDGKPITGVEVMTRLEDRRRTLCPEGRPLVTGVAPVADAWASTNPTLGRGTTLALLHAVALRNTIRAVGLTDPARSAVAWHDATERELGPAYDAVLTADRHRLAEIDAAIDGAAYDGTDVAWRAYRMLEDVAHLDPELLRGWFRIAGMVASGTEVFGEPGFLRRLARAARRHSKAPPVITRGQLVARAHR